MHFDYYNDERKLENSETLHMENELSFIGFTKLESCVAHARVPSVETELLYEEEVKIFNCLFSDMEKNF